MLVQGYLYLWAVTCGCIQLAVLIQRYGQLHVVVHSYLYLYRGMGNYTWLRTIICALTCVYTSVHVLVYITTVCSNIVQLYPNVVLVCPIVVHIHACIAQVCPVMRQVCPSAAILVLYKCVTLNTTVSTLNKYSTMLYKFVLIL